MPTSPEKHSRKSLTLSVRNIYETFAISWPTVIDAALGRVAKEMCDQRLAGWGIKLIEHAKIDVAVIGRENMKAGETYLVMSNHQSLYDVPVLFYVIGGTIRMITKKELFKVPIFGGALREAGFISIDREDRDRAIASLAVARQKLASGEPVSSVADHVAPRSSRSDPEVNWSANVRRGTRCCTLADQSMPHRLHLLAVAGAIPFTAELGLTVTAAQRVMTLHRQTHGHGRRSVPLVVVQARLARRTAQHAAREDEDAVGSP